jgi:Bardet-Biedl syndrome 2 protein
MEANGQFTIFTDDMELAGSIVQSLVAFLNIFDLQVTCDFPEELENLSQTLIQVCKYSNF